ncbi:hypothetical protein E4U19_001803 [Claviceps sp. Clav32 group G5]|nr:hypothetical protein E4U19_001803 [Claviceps sp. Clav32 group G5]
MSTRLRLGTETSGLLCVRINGITTINVQRNSGSESRHCRERPWSATLMRAIYRGNQAQGLLEIEPLNPKDIADAAHRENNLSSSKVVRAKRDYTIQENTEPKTGQPAGRKTLQQRLEHPPLPPTAETRILSYFVDREPTITKMDDKSIRYKLPP